MKTLRKNISSGKYFARNFKLLVPWNRSQVVTLLKGHGFLSSTLPTSLISDDGRY